MDMTWLHWEFFSTVLIAFWAISIEFMPFTFDFRQKKFRLLKILPGQRGRSAPL
jgi:hypothetical protein